MRPVGIDFRFEFFCDELLLLDLKCDFATRQFSSAQQLPLRQRPQLILHAFYRARTGSTSKTLTIRAQYAVFRLIDLIRLLERRQLLAFIFLFELRLSDALTHISRYQDRATG